MLLLLFDICSYGSVSFVPVTDENITVEESEIWGAYGSPAMLPWNVELKSDACNVYPIRCLQQAEVTRK